MSMIPSIIAGLIGAQVKGASAAVSPLLILFVLIPVTIISLFISVILVGVTVMSIVDLFR